MFQFLCFFILVFSFSLVQSEGLVNDKEKVVDWTHRHLDYRGAVLVEPLELFTRKRQAKKGLLGFRGEIAQVKESNRKLLDCGFTGRAEAFKHKHMQCVLQKRHVFKNQSKKILRPILQELMLLKEKKVLKKGLRRSWSLSPQVSSAWISVEELIREIHKIKVFKINAKFEAGFGRESAIAFPEYKTIILPIPSYDRTPGGEEGKVDQEILLRHEVFRLAGVEDHHFEQSMLVQMAKNKENYQFVREMLRREKKTQLAELRRKRRWKVAGTFVGGEGGDYSGVHFKLLLLKKIREEKSLRGSAFLKELLIDLPIHVRTVRGCHEDLYNDEKKYLKAGERSKLIWKGLGASGKGEVSFISKELELRRCYGLFFEKKNNKIPKAVIMSPRLNDVKVRNRSQFSKERVGYFYEEGEIQALVDKTFRQMKIYFKK